MNKILTKSFISLALFASLAYAAPAFATTITTIVVHPADLAANPADVVAAPTKWFFYNDNTDTIDDSLGSFVNGPATAPLGIGSAEITNGAVNNRTDLATYQFSGTPLVSITTLAFSAYSHSGVSGPNESPYLVFNIDFNGSDTWQKRLVYVPSANAAVPQDTWNTYDTINGGAGLWTWSGYAGNGNKWPDNNTSEYRTWNDIKSSFPSARVRVTDSFMGVRVGEPGPTNYTGDIDKFVWGTTDGGVTQFDFEPTPTSSVTMCKADSQQHPLSGWSLILKGDSVQTGITVPTNVSAGINTNALSSGMSYVAIASGTWSNQNGANPVDAEYSTTDNWATHMDGYTGYQTDILELQINQAFDPNSNWGAYNSAHTYAQSFTPSSSGPANLRIFDGSGTTPNEGWYADNSGTLNVDLYKGYAGITGENGCVTFTGVPYGSYTVAEGSQDNWANVSGLGAVSVDSSTETFNVVNRDTTLPTNATVHIFKFIKDGDAPEVQATVANAGGVSFPMFTSTYNAAFNLGPSGWTGGDIPYEASTSAMPIGASYSANEDTTTALVGTQCDGVHPYALLGYSTGDTMTAAQNGEVTGTIPSFTNLQGDKYIIVHNVTCQVTPPIKVHILKYLDGAVATADSASGYQFPMTATWQTANLNGGVSTSGNYVLGNNHGGAADQYGADTAPMAVPADYTTSEITDESSQVVSDFTQCAAGKYLLNGYRVSSVGFADAATQPLSSTAPAFTGLVADRYVIVDNSSCSKLGEIHGTKYEDHFGHGILYGGDTDGDKDDHMSLGMGHGLSGWTIYLDLNGNSTLDPGEPSTVTDSNGDYQFDFLPAGTYIVREVMQPGWSQTVPAAGFYSVVLATGQIVMKKDFANFHLGVISGMKFNDLNGNHHKDGNEPGLQGWTIVLHGPHGSTQTAVTDANGNYSFTGLKAGLYFLTEVQKPGWKMTVHPAPVLVWSGTNATNKDFGNKLKVLHPRGDENDNDNDTD